jgi:hypothetical protein
MSRHPLRRAHLIAPFGVGSLPVFPDGTSMIIAGLDHWFSPDHPGQRIDIGEYRVEEWRLQERLNVDHFRLPPDHRPSWNRSAESDSVNEDLTVPALRFPRYHACTWCGRLDYRALTEKGRLTCRFCEQQGRKWAPISQVQFVAMCASGHLTDFPFREWVHRSAKPACHLPMKISGSGGSLVSVRIRCECGLSRTMSGVTQGAGEDGESSLLSSMLNPKGPDFLCAGRRPWLGEHHDEGCGLPLVAGLRSASNTYFAETIRAIYIPPVSSHSVDDELLSIIESPRIATIAAMFRNSGGQVAPAALRQQFPGLLDRWDDDAIREALELSEGTRAGTKEPDQGATAGEESDFRAAELAVLTQSITSDQLVVRTREGSDYGSPVRDLFSMVSLVEKLRVTTVFTGFTRVRTDEGARHNRAEALWSEPIAPKDRWLPASLVFGEGILLVFDDERLRTWSAERDVIARAGAIDRAYDESRRGRRPPRDITPALVAAHTLSHLVIMRMAFESGYSAASLAERLYVDEERAAVLIYTASGDSEGTLGGLVRLGRPGYLESLVQGALDDAAWCSSDPICMELGATGGQGPDSCNLAACHSCAVLPEKACEEFNRFLDRGLVLGDHEDTLTGIASAAAACAMP